MVRTVKSIIFLLAIVWLNCGFAQADTTTASSIGLGEYGGKVSIGISILDGFGVPVRIYKHQHVLELGAYSAGLAFLYVDEFDVETITAPMIGLGYTYFGNRFLKVKKKQDKIKANGIAIRLNQIVGTYNTSIPSLSWAHETFREGRTHRSFLFELGIQYAFPHFSIGGESLNSSVGLRLRCQWNMFLK
jgi:hypothetical protein